jgi:hypothetical protein
VDPAQMSLDLAAGWSLIPYLRELQMPATQALEPISGELVKVKNGSGQVYWPEMDVNEIGDLLPGQGTKVYLQSPGTLTYLPVVSVPAPTNTPTPPTTTPVPGSNREFFLSPNGDDGRSGLSEGEAWATFEHAWTVVKPGDTITMLDGVYTNTTIKPGTIGEPGNPVTIRAQNDGKAIIDGEYERYPVWTMYQSVDYYLVIEGIVARNGGPRHVFRINGNHTTLRRVSGYNAHPDVNAHVFSVTGDNNLLEDCVAAGTGRKMVLVFKGQNNTIRRCYADWRRWDARGDVNGFCGQWPWGEGLEIYNANNNLMENSIAYGHTPRAGISLMNQYPSTAGDNRILGSMSILSGMKEDGTPMLWGPDPNNPPFTQLQPLVRPQPTECENILDFDAGPRLLSGIRVGESGVLQDSLLQDVLAWGSARYGLAFQSYPQINSSNNRVNRATLLNNGLHQLDRFGGVGTDATQEDLAKFTSVENSYIEDVWTGGSDFTTQEGEGARLANRYIDGELTNEALWPWPMEERIKDELGISVTCTAGTIINDAYAQGKAAEGIDMTGRDPNWASDPNNLVVQACNS